MPPTMHVNRLTNPAKKACKVAREAAHAALVRHPPRGVRGRELWRNDDNAIRGSGTTLWEGDFSPRGAWDKWGRMWRRACCGLVLLASCVAGNFERRRLAD